MKLTRLNTFIICIAVIGIFTDPMTSTAIISRNTKPSGKVRLSRTWTQVHKTLATAHRQTGIRYAVLPGEQLFQGTVGPYAPGKELAVSKLAADCAEAAGMELLWHDGIAILAPHDFEIETIVELTSQSGSADPSKRLYALDALERLEHEFRRNTWPGRLSILEVFSDSIDRQSMLYAMEEAPLGSRTWKLAVTALGRSRERLLARHLWWPVWMRTPGTIEIGMWGIGRSGDTSGSWALRSRVQDTWTNDPSHRYLAAMVLGMLDGTQYLKRNANSDVVEQRRAIAFGLGFCDRKKHQAVKYCKRYLQDQDAAVRYLACRSLSRLGSEAALSTLLKLAANTVANSTDRTAALDALAAEAHLAGYELAEKTAFNNQTAAALRAAAIRLLADSPDGSLDSRLQALTSDTPKPVRLAALDTLARRGTSKGIKVAASILNTAKEDVDLALATILGLGRSMAPDARKPLRLVATNPEWPSHIRRYAIEALARLANRAGQDTIATLTPVSSDAHNWLAPRLLDLESSDATMDLLLPHLTGPYRTSACGAAERLGETGYGPAVRELLEGGKVLDNHTRMSHIWAAIRATGNEAVQALIRASKSQRTSIQRTSARSLGGRRGRRRDDVAEALLSLARNRDPQARQGAIESLQLAGDPRAFDLLAEAANNDPDLRVAREAARALRLREFKSLPGREKVIKAIGGTERDPGGLTGKPSGISSQADNSFVLRTWAEHIEEDLVANITYESSLCYDRHNARTVMWGAHGRRYDSPQTGLTWFFYAGEEFLPWRRLTGSQHWPNGLCLVRGTAYDAANRVVINPHAGGGGSHGWHNDLRSGLAYSSPWILDVTTDQWYAARPSVNRTFSPTPASHDPVHGITWWWRGKMIGFDVYANDWVQLETRGPAPSYISNSGAVFDPRTGLFIVVGRHSTWALDTSEEKWKDLAPDGPHPPACPMIYDSANEVMLAFQERSDRVEVWVYHIDENRWELLPPVHPSPLAATIWDAAYDEAHNVVIISGTWSRTSTGGPTRRETWTYRYKNSSPHIIGSRVPSDVSCVTAEDGAVTISWKAPEEGKVKNYRVEWGYARQPWKAKWKVAGKTDSNTCSYTHHPDKKKPAFYRVIALDHKGQPSRPSFPARTTPRIVSHISAIADKDGKVHLSWTPSKHEDVAGYHIYRLSIKPGNAWRRRLSPRWKENDLERLTEKPVTVSEFVDTSAMIKGTANAMSWPETAAYSVRAINKWGMESGDSPMTPALPQPPGPVRVVPWADGERLTLWSGAREPNVKGYVLWRMDTWQSSAPRRVHSGSLICPAWRDNDIFLRGDRRRYYASGIDGMGVTGIPTSGTWSHGLP